MHTSDHWCCPIVSPGGDLAEFLSGADLGPLMALAAHVQTLKTSKPAQGKMRSKEFIR